MTPKGRPSGQRTSSHMAGNFLKSELKYPATVAGRYSTRTNVNNVHASFDPEFLENEDHLGSEPLQVPRRRFSKSKNFLLQAIGGRGTPQKVKLKKSIDSSSKDTLVRRISRSRRSYDPSRNSDCQLPPTNVSLDTESRDITDTTMSSHAYSEANSARVSSSLYTNSIAGAYGNLILIPQVVVTPERPVVDTENCTFWVAIEISGVLRSPEPHVVNERKTSQSSVDPLLRG